MSIQTCYWEADNIILIGELGACIKKKIKNW